MSSEPQKIDSAKNLGARSPEVDFAVVLSRIIDSIEHNPAQLWNAVYELARIKLRRETCRGNPPNRLEARRLTLALESAIEGVETFYSNRADLRALQSLDRLIKRSEIGPSEVISEPREPLLIVNQAAPQTADSDHLPIFWARAKGTSLNVKRSLPWPVAAPLLRGVMVTIFAVALGAAVSQFGLLGRQTPLSLPSQAEPAPVIRPAISRVNGAPANFRHRHFVAAGSQGDASWYSGYHDPLTVAPEEQPVKALRSSCSTRTYKVPSEGGGEASITMVRC